MFSHMTAHNKFYYHSKTSFTNFYVITARRGDFLEYFNNTAKSIDQQCFDIFESGDTYMSQ